MKKGKGVNLKKSKKRANPFLISIGLIIGLIAILAGVFLTTLSPVGPATEALPYMTNDSRVKINVDRYAFFKPVDKSSNTGFIFYPGGRVDYRSYAPLAHRLAEKGWPVAIIPMPLNLAVLGSDRASQVIKDHPEILHWVIGGHSLGGSMAAKFAIENPAMISGMIFMASYPAGDELASSTFPVLSIYASNDGLITMNKWDTYRKRFPSNTTWTVIEGGNHAGFGWYGKQQGDNSPVISLEEQTNHIVQSIDQFITSIDHK
jgi:hypothetical protein